jgi:hypothetical protein
MNQTDQLAQAALERHSLLLRDLALLLLEAHIDLSTVPAPLNSDPRSRAVAAGLVELLAARRGQEPPVWTRLEGEAEPFFLVAAAETMPRLRALCLEEAPLPLKKRNLYAPPNFLEFA